MTNSVLSNLKASPEIHELLWHHAAFDYCCRKMYGDTRTLQLQQCSSNQMWIINFPKT